MKADDSVFYTFNAVTNTVMDSTGKSVTAAGGQYFIDSTDPNNPIYGVVTLPKFTLNGNTYTVNLSTTLTDGVTSRYTLVVGGQELSVRPRQCACHRRPHDLHLQRPPIWAHPRVSYADVDAPVGSEAPSPIPLTPFSIAAGGVVGDDRRLQHPGRPEQTWCSASSAACTPTIRCTATVTVTAGRDHDDGAAADRARLRLQHGYGYVIGFVGGNGGYTVNGEPDVPVHRHDAARRPAIR